VDSARRSASHATELLLAFERECDPFRYLVRGFSLWTGMRFHVWEGLKIALGGLSPRRAGTSGSGRLDRLRAGMSEWTAYRELVAGRRRCDVLALTSTNRLRDRAGDKWRNTYYDYVGEPLPPTLYYYIDSKCAREPLNKSAVFVSARAHWARIARVKRTGFEGRDAVAELCKSFTTFLARSVPGVNPAAALAGLDHEAVRFAVLYDAMSRVLEGTGTAVVLSDCYYDRIWAVAAARSLGIPVLELQHGIVYDGHVAYQFDPATVAAHRDTLPIPDRILSFGPYFNRVFTAGGGWTADQVTDAGFPRMSSQQQAFSWSPPPAGGTLRILVSAQWILASHTRRFLTELSHALAPGIELVVKPHPLDDAGMYDGIDGVAVCDPQLDFYEALGSCHLHASVFSTTLVESVGLGVPSVVIGLPGAENANALVESAACRRVNSAAEMAELLRSLQAGPDALSAWHARTLEAARHFWAPNPGPTLRRLLEDTVEQSRSHE